MKITANLSSVMLQTVPKKSRIISKLNSIFKKALN